MEILQAKRIYRQNKEKIFGKTENAVCVLLYREISRIIYMYIYTTTMAIAFIFRSVAAGAVSSYHTLGGKISKKGKITFSPSNVTFTQIEILSFKRNKQLLSRKALRKCVYVPLFEKYFIFRGELG